MFTEVEGPCEFLEVGLGGRASERSPVGLVRRIVDGGELFVVQFFSLFPVCTSRRSHL